MIFKQTANMKLINFVSKKRIVASLILSAFFVFYAMNFNPRNINILATKSLGGVMFAYISNIVLFFIIFYLVATLVITLYRKIFKR